MAISLDLQTSRRIIFNVLKQAINDALESDKLGKEAETWLLDEGVDWAATYGIHMHVAKLKRFIRLGRRRKHVRKKWKLALIRFDEAGIDRHNTRIKRENRDECEPNVSEEICLRRGPQRPDGNGDDRPGGEGKDAPEPERAGDR